MTNRNCGNGNITSPYGTRPYITRPYVTTCSRVCMKILMEGPHFAKFGDHRSCVSRDITNLIIHVTLQEHIIKGPCDFVKGSSSVHISTLPSLVAIGIVLVDI